jgi:hypothetical protein
MGVGSSIEGLQCFAGGFADGLGGNAAFAGVCHFMYDSVCKGCRIVNGGRAMPTCVVDA